MKALQVTISGTYKGRDNEVYDYEGLAGIIPFVDDDKARQHVIGRYAKIWVGSSLDAKGKKQFPERIDDIRTCHVDELEVIDSEFSFVGKDIKKMSFEELQDLATAKDLMTVPADKDMSDISDARKKAYAAYAASVGMGDIKINEVDFNLAAMPAMIVEDGSPRRDMSEKLTNEDILAIAAKPQDLASKVKTTLTMEEMLTLAKNKNISVAQGISFDDLYAKLFVTV